MAFLLVVTRHACFTAVLMHPENHSDTRTAVPRGGKMVNMLSLDGGKRISSH